MISTEIITVSSPRPLLPDEKERIYEFLTKNVEIFLKLGKIVRKIKAMQQKRRKRESSLTVDGLEVSCTISRGLLLYRYRCTSTGLGCVATLRARQAMKLHLLGVRFGHIILRYHAIHVQKGSPATRSGHGNPPSSRRWAVCCDGHLDRLINETKHNKSKKREKERERLELRERK